VTNLAFVFPLSDFCLKGLKEEPIPGEHIKTLRQLWKQEEEIVELTATTCSLLIYFNF